MESPSIIHGINKHHVINKRKECYSIIDNIASLIATFKRYALVLIEKDPSQGHREGGGLYGCATSTMGFLACVLKE